MAPMVQWLSSYILCVALYTRRYMSNGIIHVQQSFGKFAKKLIFGYKVKRQQIHCTVERFSANQMLGDILYPGFWLVENCSTLRCICCRWTLYPKINFQRIGTCLTHVQFCGMTVGHLSYRWTCIALHSVCRRSQVWLSAPSLALRRTE